MIENKVRNIQKQFDSLANWELRYEYMIKRGKNLSPISEAGKNSQNLVKGCQSQVWLHAEFREGKIFFEGDSDALLVKGLLALVLEVFQNETPEDILKTPLDFLTTWGLAANLTPSRANGVFAMIKQIKNYAFAFQVMAMREQKS